MTPQEAIEILTHWADGLWMDKHNVTNGKFDDAVILARNALRGISGNQQEITHKLFYKACEAYCTNCKQFTKDCYEYCQGMQGRSCQAFESFKASLEHLCKVMSNSPEFEEISGNNEKIPSISCKSDKNLQGFDSDYLQSKIDAFTEARKKDGKTSEELLNECRGGELLTWQDVKRIVNIADEIIADGYKDSHGVLWDEEAYYTDVLRRFKEGK